MHFLFPCHPLQPREPDELFQPQAAALREQGVSVSVFAEELLQPDEPGESIHLQARPRIPPGVTVVYRGWMLDPTGYRNLVAGIEDAGAQPLTSLAEYLACHYLPNWYPFLAEWTAETCVYPADANLEIELARLGWGRFFLKDFVKSLKTSLGSVVVDPVQAARVIDEMRRLRGTIEGGICVRRFESFVPGSEQRFFVLRGVPHAASGAIPDLVHACTRRIESPFFSVDVALRADGVPRIVEIGDGQVSDLVGWTAAAFAALWNCG